MTATVAKRDQKPTARSTEAFARQDDEAKRPHRPFAAQSAHPTLPADGIARNYAELVALLVAARHAIPLTGEELDDIIGWQERYTGKLEQPGTLYGRAAVNPSFDLWLGGLRVGLIVVKL